MSRRGEAFHQFKHASVWPAPFVQGEASPCDGCWKNDRCCENRTACDALLLYTRDAAPIRWRSAPRNPSRDAYAKLARQLRDALANAT
jgi:hypothetical protein